MLLLTSCWLFADTLSSKHPELVTWFDWGFTFFTGLGWGLVFGFKEKNQKFWLAVVTCGGYLRILTMLHGQTIPSSAQERKLIRGWCWCSYFTCSGFSLGLGGEVRGSNGALGLNIGLLRLPFFWRGNPGC